jgi:hypothetical protein
VSGADDAARPPTTSDVAVALDAFDGVPVAALPERIGATTVHAFARVSSTMDVAHALAAAGAVAGTLVLADAQTSGPRPRGAALGLALPGPGSGSP